MDQQDSTYREFSNLMKEEVQKASGFLGMESYREDTGRGVTISYWESLKSIQRWKENTKHLLAQRYGIEHAYASFDLKVCRIEREYNFKASKKT
jgi:heme-degrading monooxygenase HmoA